MKKLVIIILLFLFTAGCTESTTDEPTAKNNPPEIKSLSAQTDEISGLTQIQIVAFAEDPDGDDLEYQWESRQGTFVGSGAIVNWISPNALGIKLITCTVSDGKGGTDSDSVQVKVTEYNSQPLFISELKLINEDEINIGTRVRLEASTNSSSPLNLNYKWAVLDIGGVKNLLSDVNSLEFEPEKNGPFKCIYFVENSKNEYAYKTIDIIVGEDTGNSGNNDPVINRFELSKNDFFVGDSIIVDVEYEDPDADETEFDMLFVGKSFGYSIGDLGENRYYIQFNSIEAEKTLAHFIIVGIVRDSKDGKGYAFQEVAVNKR